MSSWAEADIDLMPIWQGNNDMCLSIWYLYTDNEFLAKKKLDKKLSVFMGVGWQSCKEQGIIIWYILKSFT